MACGLRRCRMRGGACVRARCVWCGHRIGCVIDRADLARCVFRPRLLVWHLSYPDRHSVVRARSLPRCPDQRAAFRSRRRTRNPRWRARAHRMGCNDTCDCADGDARRLGVVSSFRSIARLECRVDIGRGRKHRCIRPGPTFPRRQPTDVHPISIRPGRSGTDTIDDIEPPRNVGRRPHVPGRTCRTDHRVARSRSADARQQCQRERQAKHRSRAQ